MLRRLALALTLCFAATAAFAQSGDWRQTYKEIRFGISSSENSEDALTRSEPFRKHLEAKLGVPVKLFRAHDYAALVEAMRANQLDFARMGPATYALAYKVMGRAVEPLGREIDNFGSEGYHSVLAVRADSPYKTLDDLKGKIIGWADPNSTSGYQFPLFYLRRQGYDPAVFFSKSLFSGSHENGILGLVQGTFDVAATFWNNEERGNIQRMELKKMIPQGSTRIIWKSPLIPNGPIAARTALPAELKELLITTFIDMPAENPEAWKALTDGHLKGVVRTKHEDYLDVIAVATENDKDRKKSN